MKKIDELTEGFQSKIEEFLIGCDAIEEEGLWDKEEYGEMDAFFQNEILSVIIHLIVVDGEINEKEVEYLNKNFRMDYTIETLREVYENCPSQIDSFFDDNFKDGLKILKGINGKLADAYVDLFHTICDIIVESDDQLKGIELEEVKKLNNIG